MYVEVSSNGFIVDDTEPVIAKEPSFSAKFVTYDAGTDQFYQMHRTMLKVEWQVDDPESYIERQYLTIKSHVGGEFNSAPTQVQIYQNNNSLNDWYVISPLKNQIKLIKENMKALIIHF